MDARPTDPRKWMRAMKDYLLQQRKGRTSRRETWGLLQKAFYMGIKFERNRHKLETVP